MYLGKAYYINLNRQPLRKAFCHTMLRGVGIHPERIERIPAIDGQKYPNNEEIARAAVADGFLRFKDRESWEYGEAGSLALRWTWCRAFRQIAANHHDDHCVLLMVDDFSLCRPWRHFRELVEGLDDLRICLFVTWEPDGYKEVESVPCGDELYHGFNGMAGDAVMVLTPSGARLLLDWFDEMPWYFPENLTYVHSRESVPGCYVVKNPYDWTSNGDVCHEIGLLEGNSRVYA